ncbi:gallinacin-9-like [Antechinus flavipes]|uniref:gallinacin-9-like n=1 Tax=Antechinus flavipes TaxID=38775 RepID=UPI0022362873|nr:gallinacin-9-like [Antechinus flavipes]
MNFRFEMSQFTMRNLYLVFMVLFVIFFPAETGGYPNKDIFECMLNRGICVKGACNTIKATIGTCAGRKYVCCKY